MLFHGFNRGKMNKNATETTGWEIDENSSRWTTKRRPGWLVSGLLPAVMVGFVVIAIGMIARPPAYVARATFAVDWNEMASVFGDDNAEKVRALVRKGIITETTALPQSNELSDMLDPDGTLNTDQRAALTAKVRKSLSVTLSRQTEEQDCFAIEFRAGDATQAEAVVQHVLRGQLSDLNNQAFVIILAAAARSKSNLDDIKERQAREQRESENRGSSASEWQEFEAGLSLAKNALGMFLKPAKVVQEVRVENSVGSHVVKVLFAAVYIGGLAGVAGLGFRKVLLGPKRRNTATHPVTSAVPPKLPPPNMPPLIAQFDMRKPPILPPPFLNR
jgi:hypothetical protein